jgi:hypothetical protein
MPDLLTLFSVQIPVAQPLADKPGDDDARNGKEQYTGGGPHRVQRGPRPLFLVDDMDDSRLKRKLQKCAKGPFKNSDFSIGHRGAAMRFPEHTRESYEAAARMGAGILECDVTFTKDKELVCRHSQCDLHTTTNILATPLAAQCSAPFQCNARDCGDVAPWPRPVPGTRGVRCPRDRVPAWAGAARAGNPGRSRHRSRAGPQGLLRFPPIRRRY